MMNRLRSIVLVAGFDFLESVRSRKAVALLVLYLAGACAATGIFITILRTAENVVADGLHVSRTDKAGTMTTEVMHSEQLKRAAREMIGDEELADALLSTPPLALFYGWLAFAFIPILVILFSCDSVSTEVSSGSARFALFRADRLSWAIGKLGGQAILMTVGIVSGGLATFVLGWIFLASFEPGRTALWLLRFSGRAWFYGFPFLGLAVGLSLLTRSVMWSRGLGILGLCAVALVGWILGWDLLVDFSPTIVPTLHMLVPSGHKLDLWRPDFLDRLPALVMLSALACTYFGVGAFVFTRRDG